MRKHVNQSSILPFEINTLLSEPLLYPGLGAKIKSCNSLGAHVEVVAVVMPRRLLRFPC